MIDLIKKIEAKVNKYDCWTWQGKMNGREPDFQYKRTRVKVREVLYGWYNGCFPPKKVYRNLKKCVNLKCINPRHMQLKEPTNKEIVSAELPNDTELQPEYNIETKEHQRGFGVPNKHTATSHTPEPHDRDDLLDLAYRKYIKAKKQALTRQKKHRY